MPSDTPPSQPSPYQPPQVPSGMQPTVGEGDATGGVIPYKNVPALMAYYCGVFSLIPCLGLVLGIIGFILGIIGLQRRRENPAVKGAVHAWIGIVMGGLFAVIWGGLVAAGLIAAYNVPRP